MPLQLPAGTRWHAPASASHIFPTSRVILQTSHERGLCEWGALCSFGTSKSCKEPLSLVSTFGASLVVQPKRIPSRGLASHSRLELLVSWLLPSWCRWPNLHSHLGQLSGQQWVWWPPHLLQLLCLLYAFVQLLLTGRAFLHWCWCWSTSAGGTRSMYTWALVFTFWTCSSFPFFGVTFVLTILERECQSIGNQNSLTRVMWHLSWIFHYHYIIVKGSTFHMMDISFYWAFSLNKQTWQMSVKSISKFGKEKTRSLGGLWRQR